MNTMNAAQSPSPSSSIAPPVSVCMATYNGARYLPVQLASILEQLGPRDELVAVDDASCDKTVAILEGLDDPRVRVYRNERNLGHVRTFARALSLARNDILFMADQDDLWLPDRLRLMREGLLGHRAWVVSANARYMDAEGRATTFDAERVRPAQSRRHAANIASIFAGRRRYYGCCMALRREILPLILPVPAFVESHDLWIAMAGNVAQANVHLDCDTLVRRVHGTNASVVSRPLSRKLWSRVVFLRSLAVLLRRRAAMARAKVRASERTASR